jgi:hypothetical protein
MGQRGCTWSDGPAVCAGTLTPCNQLSVAACATQAGCQVGSAQ